MLTKRSIARIARGPEQLLDVTIQPVIFVLLFTYVFGSAIVLPGGGNYHEYLIGGMFGTSKAGTAPGTAVGISTDMKSGLIDRFRSLPTSRSAVLAGRVLSVLCTQVLAVGVLVVTGLAVGGGIHNGLADALAAIGLSLLIAFALTWAGACAGTCSATPTRPPRPAPGRCSTPSWPLCCGRPDGRVRPLAVRRYRRKALG